MNWLRSMLSASGDDSYKRTCGVIMCGYLGALILGDFLGHAPNAGILSLIQWVLLATIGGAAIDHFTKGAGQ